MTTDSTMLIKKPMAFKSVPVVCSWCGQLYKISRWKMDSRQTRKSHGVCQRCFDKHLKDEFGS